jgi:hypothetical protein
MSWQNPRGQPTLLLARGERPPTGEEEWRSHPFGRRKEEPPEDGGTEAKETKEFEALTQRN